MSRVDGMLATITARERVAIPWAVESGSRAWGFPSPDSDYDCRFLFVRPLEQTLTLWPRRDVIEVPADAELDLNGWELGKALKLLLNGNAVIIEWLTSPIVYRGGDAFRDAFLGLARRVIDRRMIARHYLHLGERQRRTYFADGTDVPLKKIFYALRPAAALRWLRLRPDEAVAPMDFPTLLAESDVSDEVSTVMTDLLARKAATRELGTGPLPPLLAGFIDAEFRAAAEHLDSEPARVDEAKRKAADRFYQDAIARYEH